MKANPNYWQAGKPYLDAVEFLYVDNDNQRVLQIQGGQVDIIDTVPPANVSSLKASSGLSVDLFPAWQVDLLVMNEKLPQFADRHVRRAITYAIDRPALVHAASFGTAKPGGSFFPPSLEYYSASTPVLEYSLAQAKAELAQSKFPKGFSTKLLIDGGVQKWVTFAEIIKAQLQVDRDQRRRSPPLDHSAFEATFQKYDYDMFIDYAINDISDPDEMASFEVDVKNGGSESYWSNYDNPAAINLVHEAEAEYDTAKRAALYAQIQEIVAEDAPFVALDYPPYIYAVSGPCQRVRRQPRRRLPPRGRLANLIDVALRRPARGGCGAGGIRGNAGHVPSHAPGARGPGPGRARDPRHPHRSRRLAPAVGPQQLAACAAGPLPLPIGAG